MTFDYQISSQVAETRRADLMASARISRQRKVVRTRNAQLRPRRRWLGHGARAPQSSCPAAA